MSLSKVRVNQGIIKGCEEKLPNGRNYLRFSGIPYAKPPINKLRFRPPQKLEKFDRDEIDCTRERDSCFQKSPLTKKYIGSENCLNLNVYVPVQQKTSEKLAVMFYIHGGGFKYDSNSKSLYSPEYLLMENVIVVTINYRLHVLGFLSLPSMGISGNAGLKDQQMALQWVHENISAFNGDPERICLFGVSGGSASVHFQVMNKISRQYISCAICQSGTVMNDWAFYGQTEKTAVKLAGILGCQSDSIKDVYNTLMTTPAKTLYDNCDKVITEDDLNACIRTKWRMVIEEENEDAFITEPPMNSIINQAGLIKLPMIFGTTNGDGMPEIASIVSRNRFKVFDDNLEYMLPRSLKVTPPSAAQDFAAELRKFYFNNHQVTAKNVKDLLILRTDVDYFIPLTITNELFVKYQPNCKQFLYEFSFDGKLNLQKEQMKMAKFSVAGHADDTFYLFGGDLVSKVHIEEYSREWYMRKTMCKLWSNFAKYHDPTPDHDNPLLFKWNPVQSSEEHSKEIDLDYLVINDEMKMIRNLNRERREFWRNAYRKWNKDILASKL